MAVQQTRTRSYYPEWRDAILAAQERALIDTGLAIVATAAENIQQNGNVFTGNLMRSLGISNEIRKESDGRWLLDIGIMATSSRESAEQAFQYAMAIERGTRPHFPPLEPIRHWVRRKLHISEDEADGVAWAICIAISRTGTRARPFYLPAYDRHVAELQPRFQQYLAEELDRRGIQNVA